MIFFSSKSVARPMSYPNLRGNVEFAGVGTPKGHSVRVKGITEVQEVSDKGAEGPPCVKYRLRSPAG